MLFALLFACETEPECTVHSDCDDGLACLYETCLAPQCWTSDQCQLGAYCDPDELVCAPGCRNESDCFAGETCEEGVCEVPECSNTQRDCPVGNDCIAGACSQDPNVCSIAAGGCPEGTLSYGSYCYRECTVQSDCPAAFSCVDRDDGTSLCYSDCSWLRQNGYL